MLVCQRCSASVSGRKFFQRRCMSWSYRNRGYEARIHRKLEERSRVFVARMRGNSPDGGLSMLGFRNRRVVSAFISMMFAYSARKNRANGPAEYSTLKPETNSDSPSVRSNGERFVSASVEINHIIARGQEENRRYNGSCEVARVVMV